MKQHRACVAAQIPESALDGLSLDSQRSLAQKCGAADTIPHIGDRQRCWIGCIGLAAE
jgi:hypothetical protein